MGGMKPFDPQTLVLIALLNPAVILVGFAMGRAADQWQKIIVAGFAAALAGFLLMYVAVYFRILPVKGIGGEAGLVALQFLFGMGWAALGYMLARRKRAG
ncbi:MAG: hypothetical protein ABL908_08710 [Hyphomicrobium sp.]